MYNGLLGLHSVLRWALIVFLVINIIRMKVEAGGNFDIADKKWSLRLLITTHINLLVAIYLYFFGERGIKILWADNFTMKDVMKAPSLRFWIVEHPTMMLIAIVLITISHSYSKKIMAPLKKHRVMMWLYILALLVIFAAVPWPFRELGGEKIPWLRPLY